jgi:hypothetical protein
MSISRFIVVNFPTETSSHFLKAENILFFDYIASTLNEFLDYEVTSEKK